MKTRILWLLSFIALSISLKSQTPYLDWVTQTGSTSNDRGFSITIDAFGNSYTTGYFIGTVDFNPGPGTAMLTSGGGGDIFVQKLNAKGELIWVKQMKGSTQMYDGGYGTSITTDVVGNVYITGEYIGTVDFDPGPGVSNLTGGLYNMFIQKLDTNGNLIWVKGIQGEVYPEIVKTNKYGSVYVSGSFNGTVDFDPGGGIVNLSVAPSFHFYGNFILKLNSNNGNFQWATKVGESNYHLDGTKITIDTSGNVYSTGRFYGTVDFDPGLGVSNLTSYGPADNVFIQKLDTAGNLLWVKQIGSNTYWHCESKSVTTDINGNVYTTGSFSGTLDFNPGLGVSNLTSVGGNDVFIQKLDVNGNFLWGKKIGGGSSDVGYSITTDVDGSVYTTGLFNNVVDFDPSSGASNLTAVG
ncbi:MAG: SBBP repeat-containing protein, partial [Flavobacteriales bacterium]|nr:SBBP repeat-containing protein [Flavobacteriales bacterium]